MFNTAAFHASVQGLVAGFGGLKETKMFLPHPRVKVSIVGSLRDREVACSASDRQGANFESCVWRTVSSHHPQEVLLAQFSLYVHKGGLKPDSFHFLQTGKLPDDWVEANVAPVFKKGDRHSPANYRPISLTCVCAKILEHIICKQIISHFSKNIILTLVQHGFRSKHSCESQRLITTDEFIKNFEGKTQTDVVVLDFSKAFDVVSTNASYTNSTTTDFREKLLIGFKIS